MGGEVTVIVPSEIHRLYYSDPGIFIVPQDHNRLVDGDRFPQSKKIKENGFVELWRTSHEAAKVAWEILVHDQGIPPDQIVAIERIHRLRGNAFLASLIAALDDTNKVDGVGKNGRIGRIVTCGESRTGLKKINDGLSVTRYAEMLFCHIGTPSGSPFYFLTYNPNSLHGIITK